MQTFTASRLSDDNSLFPCKIIVCSDKITVRIPGLFGNKDKDIRFDKISEVSVDTRLVGYSTITFYTTGTGVVRAHGFTKSEVKEIKELIESDNEDSTERESEPDDLDNETSDSNNDDSDEYDSKQSRGGVFLDESSDNYEVSEALKLISEAKRRGEDYIEVWNSDLEKGNAKILAKMGYNVIANEMDSNWNISW